MVPACAGVILLPEADRCNALHGPRVRGGDPIKPPNIFGETPCGMIT